MLCFLLYTFESTDLVEKNSTNNFIKELGGGKTNIYTFPYFFKIKKQ